MFQSTTTLAILLFMATTASYAQGLGGLLNKAKEKINKASQTTDKPVETAVRATQGGLPASGEDPQRPRQ